MQGTLKPLGSKRHYRNTGPASLRLFDGDNETIDKMDPSNRKEDGLLRIVIRCLARHIPVR